jgi:hypothetical protein
MGPHPGYLPGDPLRGNSSVGLSPGRTSSGTLQGTPFRGPLQVDIPWYHLQWTPPEYPYRGPLSGNLLKGTFSRGPPPGDPSGGPLKWDPRRRIHCDEHPPGDHLQGSDGRGPLQGTASRGHPRLDHSREKLQLTLSTGTIQWTASNGNLPGTP